MLTQFPYNSAGCKVDDREFVALRLIVIRCVCFKIRIEGIETELWGVEKLKQTIK